MATTTAPKAPAPPKAPAQQQPPAATASGSSDKKILPAFLLCFFLGCFGAHRFFVGKIGTGILQLVTLGGLGIWALIDFILIIIGKFTDKEGRPLTEWT